MWYAWIARSRVVATRRRGGGLGAMDGHPVLRRVAARTLRSSRLPLDGFTMPQVRFQSLLRLCQRRLVACRVGSSGITAAYVSCAPRPAERNANLVAETLVPKSTRATTCALVPRDSAASHGVGVPSCRSVISTSTGVGEPLACPATSRRAGAVRRRQHFDCIPVDDQPFCRSAARTRASGASAVGPRSSPLRRLGRRRARSHRDTR
jgi:hypothetical protein